MTATLPTSRLVWPRPGGWAAVGGFVALTGAANAANAAHVLPVGFGLMAPAGAYLSGVVLAIRAWIQRALGGRWLLTVVAAGAALSWLVASPRVAVASTVAFVAAELASITTHARLQVLPARWVAVVSGLCGAIADSSIFVGLAYGSASLLAGQLLAKAWAIGLATAIQSVRWGRWSLR